MDNYGTCKTCEYGDPDGYGWKWKCTYYNTLEDPDEVKDCRMYRKRGSGGGCFLTEACCTYKGAPDDCHELTVLRQFRDGYLKKQSYGESLIHDYYEEAPKIVDAIARSEEKNEILESIYNQISSIVKLIETGKNDEAVIKYMMMVHNLSRKHLH